VVSLFFSLFIITIIPLILNSKVSILNFNYFFSSIFMAISVCLISLIAGLLAKTQIMGQMIGLPIMFMISFLPMLATINNFFKIIVHYSFMSLFYDYIQNPNFTLPTTLNSLTITFIWILLLILSNYLLLKFSRKD
ncbi:hypothetical protein CBF92_10740, partial [Limosilactobacillus reuteri]